MQAFENLPRMVPVSSILALQLFTLDLDSENQALFISPKESEAEISLQHLKEIEQIWSWLTSNLQISSVVLQGQQGRFFKGANLQELCSGSTDDLKNYFERIQRLTYAAFLLPQTIILDLGEGAKDVAAEFSLLADIRLAKVPCLWHLDHLVKGLVPSAGGMGILSAMLGPALTRNLALSGLPLTADELKTKGLVLETYNNKIDRDAIIEGLIKQINAQSPVARIQTKRALLEVSRRGLEEGLQVERTFGRAAHHLQDWKNGLSSNHEKIEGGPRYTPAGQIGQKIRNLSGEPTN